MPSVCTTPELIAHVETPAILREHLQARRARLGFWRTLVHRITTHIPHTLREQQAPACTACRPFETPMDQLVREHPSLSVCVLATI